jgi:hypothetical protein
MHLHVSRVRRNGKLYAYAQLLQSYRRDDGMPTQRVVAKLGCLSDVEIANLRTALKASRQDQRVVLPAEVVPSTARFLKPTQNLRYLDVAVMHELWREWGLGTLLRELMPASNAQVDASDVVAALAIQRCVDPGSKLYAERWFPSTALPELLPIKPEQFNNTRVHRVLEQLDEITPSLMQRLPALYQKQQGAFAVLFMDVTDTWFVGHGPELAERAKTKEGIVERKVGIVLLCNEHGYPLRWHVVAGKKAESHAMHALVDDIRDLSWATSAPLICDRSMGKSANLVRLMRNNVRFVTALTVTEFGAYTDRIPFQPLIGLQPSTKQSDAALCKQAGKAVVQAGMKPISDTLYVLDLGEVSRHEQSEEPKVQPVADDLAARAVRLARQTQSMVEQGLADHYQHAGRRLGLTDNQTQKYRKLLALDDGILADIQAGAAAGVTLAKLLALRPLDPDEQRRSFDALISRSVPANPASRSAASPTSPSSPEGEHDRLTVRAVVAFNPDLFVQKRRTAQERLQATQSYVDALNVKLARPGARRTIKSIEAEMDRVLRAKSLLEVYRFYVEQREDGHQVRLELDEHVWQRRRSYDGFSVIVAHPKLQGPPETQCQLYRSKDAVEKDFGIIKGLIKLRPIWHWTDAKVRAHVTLCMLALLLERTLDTRLGSKSAASALESLRTCCLNRFEDDSNSHYIVTQPDAEQAELLRTLKLEHLADDDDMASRVTPRQPGLSLR